MLVWFSSSAHPEKPKKKECTNDARIARYSAQVTAYVALLLFLVLGERREAAMKSMKAWLTRNQRMINGVVLGVFSILLLAIGLIGIFG